MIFIFVQWNIGPCIKGPKSDVKMEQFVFENADINIKKRQRNLKKKKKAK